eukprot:PhF_6_TR13592/c0_g1_i1/m.21748
MQQIVCVLRGHHRGSVTSLRFNADGTYLLSGSRDGSVCLWTIPHGTHITTIKAHDGAVGDVGFIPPQDGDNETMRIMTCGRDGTTQSWKVWTDGSHPPENLWHVEDKGAVCALTVVPGVVLVGGEEGIVRARDTNNGKLLGEKSFGRRAITGIGYNITPRTLHVIQGGDMSCVQLYQGAEEPLAMFDDGTNESPYFMAHLVDDDRSIVTLHSIKPTKKLGAINVDVNNITPASSPRNRGKKGVASPRRQLVFT